MKTLLNFALCAFLIACTPKPATTESVDTVKVENTDTVVTPVQTSADTVITPVLDVEEKPIVKTEPASKGTKCKFLSLDTDECLRIKFDCGDFSDAVITSLNPEQQKLWNSLMVFLGGDHGDFPSANPELVGKSFDIQFKEIDGDICTSQQTSKKGKVKSLTTFKRL